jgi:haloacid dehalogenase-like hydrolase/Family of unknown function (DUF6496)
VDPGGEKVKSRKQAIAIALSQVRKKGKKVPAKGNDHIFHASAAAIVPLWSPKSILDATASISRYPKIFDRVVAENGAVIYEPMTEKERLIAPGANALFVERLKQLNVAPLSIGQSIVATRDPHQRTVLQVIQELGLELQIIFNKGAVMVLPPGVNKAVGLSAALRGLGLSPHNVVGVGDAENDHAFLHLCGCSAAVANALPMVREAPDIKLMGADGAGVVELMERICGDEAGLADRHRHGVAALKSVQVVVGLGEHAYDVIAKFCEATGVDAPKNTIEPNDDEILVWMPGLQRDPQRVRPEGPRQSHKRHIREYAEGTLRADNSFYFRGPDNALNLRAQNLMVFIQIADGVDYRTWTHHLRRGDYSAGFLHAIKDDSERSSHDRSRSNCRSKGKPEAH